MKILLAYVPSATSEAAFEYAVAEAAAHGGALLVLASESSGVARKDRAVTDRRPLTERLDETGLEYTIRTVPRRDDPADDILRAVRDDAVDLVVMGIRKRTPIGKILVGSTSQRVVMEAPCPVVLVKPKDFVQPQGF
ncbi:universal stress protein [Helcobacillus massiliensis]|uniref:universal stress protein n=1 Tax=Helcobacillus massiliensis TaxID=521392 RepID=UPI0025527203|nr:universal stress protein [Helcobacillus massiliensis]MDK7741917.1 universal stress protein [Helcobacillus massiliensis]WOO92892.1 universal stress protein [Helcobacillus massiliensis]